MAITIGELKGILAPLSDDLVLGLRTPYNPLISEMQANGVDVSCSIFAEEEVATAPEKRIPIHTFKLHTRGAPR